ncbi:MAG TPA: hypothetical protein VEW46_15670 [Pyrinomonadaceae bacterium]|nr:hypothetical protein [Pyrinomonadaceae bacterium]
MSDLAVESTRSAPQQSASRTSKLGSLVEIGLLAACGAVTVAWVGVMGWAAAHLFG